MSTIFLCSLIVFSNWLYANEVITVKNNGYFAANDLLFLGMKTFGTDKSTFYSIDMSNLTQEVVKKVEGAIFHRSDLEMLRTYIVNNEFEIKIDTGFGVITSVGPIIKTSEKRPLNVLEPFYPDRHPIISWNENDNNLLLVKNEKLMLIDVKNESILFSNNYDNIIEDIKWSEDSKQFFVLIRKERISFWPWHWILMISGHPVKYSSFEILLYDINGTINKSYSLKNEMKSCDRALLFVRDKN
ncbi:MAG: hypothetical protein HQK83_17490 [Fibrobacteria bacterium]|nr:hypothetical protein [Fibrobacteria bacterium]